MQGRGLAILGFTLLTLGSARAADFPSRYEPVESGLYYSWNGFYLGINGGYGFGTSNWTDNIAGVGTGDFNVNGALVGGTIGYNMQLGSAVLGLEADAAWSNIKGSAVCGTTCSVTNNWLGTGRARIGYAFDRFLPYLTGGVAFGGLDGTVAGFGTFSNTQVGWTGGGGLEFAFTGNWTGKVEYLYVDLGNASCNAACSGGNPLDVAFTTSLIRGGINYKF